jgi:hypothetical protein
LSENPYSRSAPAPREQLAEQRVRGAAPRHDRGEAVVDPRNATTLDQRAVLQLALPERRRIPLERVVFVRASPFVILRARPNRRESAGVAPARPSSTS